jgi:tripartite-type tricarboxylate transporter receptor subunit TctC
VARAQAAGFPSKPIRIVVPFNAGSGSDSTARVYGEVMSRSLGQPIVVENRPGGSGLLAIQNVKQAPADGYTMFIGTTSPMCVMPVLTKNLPYDAFKRSAAGPRHVGRRRHHHRQGRFAPQDPA